jgi:hypothetical protein
MRIISGAKAQIFFMARIAGINACSTLWGKNFQGLKPQVFNAANGTTAQPSVASLSRAKRSSHALTLVSMRTTLPQRLKPVLIQAETAGLKACSTPRRIVHGSWENKNACSTLAETQQSLKQAAFSPLGVC